MKLNHLKPSAMAISIAIAGGLTAIPTQAQVLEEVMVTATKRTVGMQDVPISLSVMDGKRIAEQGINSLEDIAVYMPNVHIAQSGGGDQLFIRGVGSGSNYGFEQSVGTFIDGVYFGRGQASRSAFLDIERVEVLKGPQSTLFGKNTVAGAINITTKKSGDEFEGSIELRAEPEFGGQEAIVILSGPITDNFGARFVITTNEQDGYMDNTFTGDEEPSFDNTVGRLVLSWQPSDDLDLTFKYENGKSDNEGRQDKITVATPLAISRYQQADPNFAAGVNYDKSQANVGGPRPAGQFHDAEWDIFGLTAEWTIGEHTIKSITGYVDYEFENYLDGDYGPLAFTGRGRTEEHKQLTQEFIFSSPTGQTIEYLGGLFYQKEDLTHDRFTDAIFSAAGLPAAFDGTGQGTFDQDAETMSVFTQVTWNLSDDLRVIGGVRYSHDEKEFEKTLYVADPYTSNANTALAGTYDAVLNFSTDHVFNSNGATVCTGVAYNCLYTPSFDNRREEDHVTGDITLQWDATQDMMTYFKVSNGYKAGGFDELNGRGSLPDQEYEDESVVSYEVGAKMDLWEGRARLNIAVFSSEYDDVQVSTFDGNAGSVVGNAAKSEVQGIEIDGSIALTEELTFTASVAYLDAKYDEYDNAACTELQIIAVIAAGGTRSTCTQDLSGETLQFSPEYSGNVAIDYTTDLTESLVLKLGVDIIYTDDIGIANDRDSVLDQEAYTKVNARIGLIGNDNTWSIALLGKNLTDEITTNWGNDVPLASQGFGQTYFQHLEAPRSYEIQAKYNF